MQNVDFGSEYLLLFHLPLSTCHFLKLLCLFMNGMFTTESAIFFELQLIRRGSFILRRRIIPPFTLRTGQS
jgi:hypothetical protein